MIFALCFGLIFTAAGGFLLWSGIKAVTHSKQIINWPTTHGVVLTSVLGVRQRSYIPAIKYSYTIQGQMYVGTRITLGADWITSSSEQAQAKLQQYPVEQPCRVYYNPNDAAESALETASGRTSWSQLLAGVAFFLIGLVVFIVALFQYFF